MRNFTVNKLWELRAELDKAVITNDYDSIKEIKAKYLDLVEGEWDFSRAFICYNHAFWNDGQRRSHNVSNIDAILKNIEAHEKKYIDGKDVSVKLKSQYATPCLAEEIWVLRAMYDKFLLQGRKAKAELEIQQNMILGKAIGDRLQTLIHMEQTERYHKDLLPILVETRDGYQSVYGDNRPKINYAQIAEEFLER